MNSLLKKWIVSFSSIAVASLGTWIYSEFVYSTTDGFTPDAIQFEIPFREEWEVPPLSKQNATRLREVLSQPYTYLGKGARSFAFVSEDGKYVLKFFKFRYHTPHWAAKFLPSLPPFKSFKQRKMKKVSLHTVLNGYRIAYDVDPQGTGLLYIHLNPTSEDYPSVMLTDKRGYPHQIDLDKTRFVVQRRVREMEEELNGLLESGDPGSAKKRIRQLFALYLSHYRKGVCDHGTGILRNNGFDGRDPIHFDVGKMTREETVRDPAVHRSKLVPHAQRVADWLRERHPRYSHEVILDLEDELFEIYGERIVLK